MRKFFVLVCAHGGKILLFNLGFVAIGLPASITGTITHVGLWYGFAWLPQRWLYHAGLSI